VDAKRKTLDDLLAKNVNLPQTARSCSVI
jgi:hypothetical protein